MNAWLKWLLSTNLFVLLVGILQTLGSAQYAKNGAWKFAILYFLYALTNFVIWFCKGE